ncbi:hypothetical protein Bbelb_427730 [Branchiostoma belcheri]|nr:hypothetical protein Bbelb_427730 [Branchiostoma belcheri]
MPMGSGKQPRPDSPAYMDAPGSSLDPARDLTATRPNCKSRSEPYRKPHGSRRETDRAPDGSLTETGRQGDQNRRTLGVMTRAGVYTEDMPNGRRFKCDLSIRQQHDCNPGRQLENLFLNHGLEHALHEATRGGNLLDLIATSHPAKCYQTGTLAPLVDLLTATALTIRVNHFCGKRLGWLHDQAQALGHRVFVEI